MKIEQMLSNNYCSEKQLGEEFYYVASDEKNSTLIKQLFLKLESKHKFTSSVLTYGILATLEHKKDDNFILIKQFMDKNNISLNNDILTNALLNPLEENPEESFSIISGFMKNNKVFPASDRMISYVLNLIESKKSISNIMDFWKETGLSMDNESSSLQAIYLCANKNKRTLLADTLNENFNIIPSSLKEDMGNLIVFMSGTYFAGAELSPNGSLLMSGAMGGPIDDETERLVYYSENPFLFYLKYFNAEKLDSFFEKDKEISSSLVTHALVRSIFYNNHDSIIYLFSQPQCAEIIKNSSILREFIMSKDEFNDDLENNKLEARLALSFIDSKKSSDLALLKNKIKP